MAGDEFFAGVEGAIPFEGPGSDNPLAFRWYDAERVVGDSTMADQLRFSVAYWHSFAADGADMFGSGTWDRPWTVCWIGMSPRPMSSAARHTIRKPATSISTTPSCRAAVIND